MTLNFRLCIQATKLLIIMYILSHVHLGPATVDFGQVCLRSQSQKELSIVNNLNRFIHVEVNVSKTPHT